MKEKLKAIYKCEKLEGDDLLVIWHNQVIEKRVDELTVSDVARCFRQNLFLEIAYEMLLVYLLHNPYEGDVSEGELMDKASEIENGYIKKYKDTIIKIIENAHRFIETHEWEFDEDKSEYVESVNSLANIINN